MPKRILDFDALWSSDKLLSCQEQNRVEYAWLYGLADANGSFEMTNLRVILGKVSPIRPSLTVEKLADIFRDFETHGLLFAWTDGGKKFGHWVGSTKDGRLPVAAHRARYVRFAPEIPKNEYLAYTSGSSPDKVRTGLGFGLGLGLELEGKGLEQQRPLPSTWNVTSDGQAVTCSSCNREIPNSKAAMRHHRCPEIRS